MVPINYQRTDNHQRAHALRGAVANQVKEFIVKIDASVKSPSSTGVKETAPRASKAGAGASASPQNGASAKDNVQINPLSSQLQAMENSMDSMPVVDSARVEAIKQAISEGRFKVNPEVIADRLLATVKDLVQNHKG